MMRSRAGNEGGIPFMADLFPLPGFCGMHVKRAPSTRRHVRPAYVLDAAACTHLRTCASLDAVDETKDRSSSGPLKAIVTGLPGCKGSRVYVT